MTAVAVLDRAVYPRQVALDTATELKSKVPPFPGFIWKDFHRTMHVDCSTDIIFGDADTATFFSPLMEPQKFNLCTKACYYI